MIHIQPYITQLNPYCAKYNDPAFCRSLPPTDTPTALLRTNVPNTAAILPCCYVETWNLPHCQHRQRISQNIIANVFILSQTAETLASSISFINSFYLLYISSRSAVSTLTGLGAERSGAGLPQNQEVYRYWKMSRLPLGPNQSPIRGHCGTITRGQCSWDAKQPIRLDPPPKLDINGAIPPRPLHLFMVCTGTKPLLYFFLLRWSIHKLKSFHFTGGRTWREWKIKNTEYIE
jgi:hypothetical protein